MPKSKILAAKRLNAKEAEHAKAIPMVDTAIKAHGLEAVAWVVNRRKEEEKLKRELAATKQAYTSKINEIERKLEAQS